MTYKERYDSDPVFRERMKSRARERYHANRERELERRREYGERNQDRLREYRKAHYERCKESDPDFLKKEAARVSAAKKRQTPEQRAAENERRRARGWTRGVRNRTYVPRPRKPRAARPPKPTPKPVPSKIREVWGKASEGSIIRKKYPTRAALAAGAARGDFE